MNNSRILPLAFVCGLLSTPAFAQLTTIGPDTPGVTEFLITSPLVTTEGCVAGCFYHPTIVDVGPGSAPFGSDPVGVATECINGCQLDPSQAADANRQGFDLYEINFSTPVNTVVALQMQSGDFGGALVSPMLEGGGDRCGGPFGGVVPSCYHVTQQLGPDSFIGNLTISGSSITSVLIGVVPGSDFFSQATAVQFGVPEPGTLSLFALALAGLAVTRKRWT